MPKLNIHFTHADIARARLKTDVDLMWEAVGSVQVLQHEDGGVFFDNWRHHVRTLADHDASIRRVVTDLMTLAPHAAYFPDFLTPSIDFPDADTAIGVVVSTHPSQLLTEIDRLRRETRSMDVWVDDLAAGRIVALQRLGATLKFYFQKVLAPYMQTVKSALANESASRIQDYLNYGPEGLLAGYEPIMTWQPPTLTIDYPVDRDLHLDGTGLVLIPCFFCVGKPVALADPNMRQVLVLPLRPESRLLVESRHKDRLGALLGTTRADILRSTLKGNTTSRLAKLNNVTPATVSHHTGALRESGLIATSRQINAAIHHITPLGLRLLDYKS